MITKRLDYVFKNGESKQEILESVLQDIDPEVYDSSDGISIFAVCYDVKNAQFYLVVDTVSYRSFSIPDQIVHLNNYDSLLKLDYFNDYSDEIESILNNKLNLEDTAYDSSRLGGYDSSSYFNSNLELTNTAIKTFANSSLNIETDSEHKVLLTHNTDPLITSNTNDDINILKNQVSITPNQNVVDRLNKHFKGKNIILVGKDKLILSLLDTKELIRTEEEVVKISELKFALSTDVIEFQDTYTATWFISYYSELVIPDSIKLTVDDVPVPLTKSALGNVSIENTSKETKDVKVKFKYMCSDGNVVETTKVITYLYFVEPSPMLILSRTEVPVGDTVQSITVSGSFDNHYSLDKDSLVIVLEGQEYPLTQENFLIEDKVLTFEVIFDEINLRLDKLGRIPFELKFRDIHQKEYSKITYLEFVNDDKYLQPVITLYTDKLNDAAEINEIIRLNWTITNIQSIEPNSFKLYQDDVEVPVTLSSTGYVRITLPDVEKDIVFRLEAENTVGQKVQVTRTVKVIDSSKTLDDTINNIEVDTTPSEGEIDGWYSR